jgi:hypothetical protein
VEVVECAPQPRRLEEPRAAGVRAEAPHHAWPSCTAVTFIRPVCFAGRITNGICKGGGGVMEMASPPAASHAVGVVVRRVLPTRGVA